MRLALMVAAGRLDGPQYLEDLVDLSIIMVRTGRMPPIDKWVTKAGSRPRTRCWGA